MESKTKCLHVYFKSIARIVSTNYNIKCIFLNAEKETQKGKYKNPKVQKSKRSENVKSNNKLLFKNRKVEIHTRI